MKSALPTAIAISIAASNAAIAAELPTYEMNGFPISPVQVQLLGAANVREQPAAATVMAPPHQQSVSTPRPNPNHFSSWRQTK
jgi:hypothetical protein